MMMQAHRLLSVGNPDAPAVYSGGLVSAAQLVTQAEHVARSLPDKAYVINLAQNRHHFLVGWLAACLREQVTLLPAAQNEDVLERLRSDYPDHHTLDDQEAARWIGEAPRCQ